MRKAPSSGPHRATDREGSVPIERFAIIDSTLREGEQFSNAHFTPEQKIQIARMPMSAESLTAGLM